MFQRRLNGDSYCQQTPIAAVFAHQREAHRQFAFLVTRYGNCATIQQIDDGWIAYGEWHDVFESDRIADFFDGGRDKLHLGMITASNGAVALLARLMMSARKC